MSDASNAWVLAGRCPHCGGGRSRASPTAYVYCDWCGALADYDFRRACADPAQMPGPVYEALLARCQPLLQRALEAGDRDGHLRVQQQLFEAWIECCPGSCPPRIRDAAYRARYRDHLAAVATAAAFDPRNATLQRAVEAAVAGLRWRQTAQGPQADDRALAALLDAVLAQQAHLHDPAFLAPLPAHPDRVAPATLARIALSTFLQGWWPYLSEKSRRLAVERCGFSAEYLPARPPAAITHCACCGADVPAPEGGRCAICDYCGSEIALTHTLDCDGCGSRLSLPRAHDADAIDCPQCRRRLEIPGQRWPELVLTDYRAPVAG